MPDRIKLKIEENRKENINKEIKEVAQALEDLCAETISSDGARNLTRAAFRALGYQIRFSRPKKEHLVLQLTTTKAIRGKENIGEIYVLGKQSEKQQQELVYLASIAGREIDHVERGEEWRRETEFHREMNDLVAHDLRSPIFVLDLYQEALEKTLKLAKESTSEEELDNHLFTVRNYSKTAKSATRRILNTARLLDLDDLNQEVLIQNSIEISPLEVMTETLEATAHDAIKAEKGLIFYWKEKDLERKTPMHLGAITTLTTNLIDNAVKYAQKETNIEILSYFDKNNLVIEINNILSIPIQVEELRKLFKKGYRSNNKKQESLFTRNQGFGLYFVEKVVRKGFNGYLIVESDYKNRLHKGRTKSFEETNFTDSQYNNERKDPKFYTKLVLPLIK